MKVGQRPASEGGPYRREENGKESEKNRKGTEKERKKIGEDGARLRREERGYGGRADAGLPFEALGKQDAGATEERTTASRPEESV